MEAILCHQTANPRTALVVLAAGDSRRFESNKLLVPVDGMPMYRHILEETAGLSKTVFRRKILVSQYEEILQSGTAYGFTTVENRDSSLGVSHSIHLALEALEQELEQGSLDVKAMADAAHTYSREVEHSDENRLLLEERLTKDPRFGLRDFLGAML